MSEMDIRKQDSQEIKTIRFADEAGSGFFYRHGPQADTITFHKGEDARLRINESGMGDTDYVRIRSKQQAKDLIEALEKAIEIGWLD